MVNPTGRSAQMVVGVCLGLLELFPALSMALASLLGFRARRKGDSRHPFRKAHGHHSP